MFAVFRACAFVSCRFRQCACACVASEARPECRILTRVPLFLSMYIHKIYLLPPSQGANESIALYFLVFSPRELIFQSKATNVTEQKHQHIVLGVP